MPATPEELQQALLAGQDGIAARAKIRTRAILKFMQEDEGAQRLNQGLVLTQPLQHMLNFLFAAEKASTEYHISLQAVPADASASSSRTLELAEKCRSRNFQVFSGETARGTLENYLALLSDLTEAGGWTLAGLSQASQLQACRGILVALGQCWRRLVFALETPRFRLLRGTSTAASLRAVAEELLGEHRRCQAGCLHKGLAARQSRPS